MHIPIYPNQNSIDSVGCLNMFFISTTLWLHYVYTLCSVCYRRLYCCVLIWFYATNRLTVATHSVRFWPIYYLFLNFSILPLEVHWLSWTNFQNPRKIILFFYFTSIVDSFDFKAFFHSLKLDCVVWYLFYLIGLDTFGLNGLNKHCVRRRR